MASNKEFVVNAKDTARTLPLLQAINAGKYAKGGLIKGYASGGMVGYGNVPIGDFVSRYIGDPYQTGDVTNANNNLKDAKAQLAKAQRTQKDNAARLKRQEAADKERIRKAKAELAKDKRNHRPKSEIKKDQAALKKAEDTLDYNRAHGKKTKADDSARIAKERRDLTTATNKLKDAEAALKKAQMTPAQQLQAGLTLGIKNTGQFIANITKLSDMGYGALAQQLLAEGGPEAEAFAASAVKLPKSSLTKLNKDVITASSQQDQLAQLPNILKIKDALKGGAKGVAAIAQVTGLSEEEIAAANESAHLFASGGIRGPGIASGPTAIFGEGRAKEAFVPYDPAHRSRAMGLVSQVASDFGMTRRSMPASRLSAAASAAATHVTNNHFTINNALDVPGVAKEIEKVLNQQDRDRGRPSTGRR
jgi:hypothetical protein